MIISTGIFKWTPQHFTVTLQMGGSAQVLAVGAAGLPLEGEARPPPCQTWSIPAGTSWFQPASMAPP